MGCGCGGGGSSSGGGSSFTLRTAPESPEEPQECEYTLETIQNWITKVYCAKAGGIYNSLKIGRRQINSYQGILLSALNYPDNICYFRDQLKDVENFITLVTALGQC